MTDTRDDTVLVVGAGPAGISAVLWLDDFDVPFRWVDARGTVGGMVHRISNNITNYAGADFDSGEELVQSFRRQLQPRGLMPESRTVTRLQPRGDHVAVQTDGDRVHRVPLVVLATGTEYRQLGVPGEPRGLDQGCVSQSATADGAKFAGKHVAVVGGGDAGFENAIRLAGHGCRVTMLLRSPDFRARPAFVQTVREHRSIDIAPIPSVVKEIEPLDEGCRLHVHGADQTTTMKVAALFVRIGVDPAIPDGCEDLDTDDDGYLVVDQKGRTSNDHILAAGDVTSCPLPSIAVAAGGGACAARTCAERLGVL